MSARSDSQQAIMAGLNDKSFENAYDNDQKLRQLLKGKEVDQTNQLAAQDASIAKTKQLAKEMGELHPGAKYGVSVSKEGASLNQAEAPLRPDGSARQDMLNQRQAAELSKRYEKMNGFNSALQEVNVMTDRDGKGGVISNPSAKLQSTGTVKSAVPTGVMGIGELLGVVPKGTSEERKGLERLVLEYQKSMAGARQTDELRKQEKAALGFITSGDPDLVAKGVRSLARNMRNATRTVQSGYPQGVRDQVHSSFGDPLDAYSSVYEDAPQPPTTPPGASQPPGAPPAGSAGVPPSKPRTRTQKGADGKVHTYTLDEQTGTYK